MSLESKKYEIAYLLSPSLSEEEALTISGKFVTLVEEEKGAVRHREDPKKRRLAYPVKKEENAYFGWITFNASPDSVSKLEKKLKSADKVLRHILVVGEEVPPQPLRTFTPRATPAKPKTPTAEVGKPEEKLDLEELDKRLEEILGK